MVGRGVRNVAGAFLRTQQPVVVAAYLVVLGTRRLRWMSLTSFWSTALSTCSFTIFLWSARLGTGTSRLSTAPTGTKGTEDPE